MTQISLSTQTHGCSQKHGSVIIFLLQLTTWITKKATRSPWCLATHFQQYQESCSEDRARGYIGRCGQNISQEQRLIYAQSKASLCSALHFRVRIANAKAVSRGMSPPVSIDNKIIENQCAAFVFHYNSGTLAQIQPVNQAITMRETVSAIEPVCKVRSAVQCSCRWAHSTLICWMIIPQTSLSFLRVQTEIVRTDFIIHGFQN